MAPAIIDLDVSRVESPILRFQEFRTLAAKPGFFCGLSSEPTNHPNPQLNHIYIYIRPYSRFSFYL